MLLSVVWFFILVGMVTVYAVLDGFDLGVGALLPLLCKTDKEKEIALHSIGPVWNGNEVWLIASGSAMVVAFPHLYASGFSGFYLALMMVLWLLILRGVGYEFRHFEQSFMWRGIWDFSFSAASLLLCLLFGLAVGNVLRGVPLNASGLFQGSFAYMLNPFALVGGLLAVAMLALHGAAYIVMKTTSELQERARALTLPLLASVVGLVVVFVGASYAVRPDFAANFTRVPILLVLPAAVVASLAMIALSHRAGNERNTFLATCATIGTLLGSAAAGLFPRMLPAPMGQSSFDLTIYNCAAPPHSLETALVANCIGLVAVVCYTVFIYRLWSGKTSAY